MSLASLFSALGGIKQPDQQDTAPSPSPSAPTPDQATRQASGIKGYLTDFFYNMGEKGKSSLGLPTQADITNQQLKTSNEQFRQTSQDNISQNETMMNMPVPVTDPKKAYFLGVKPGTMLSPAQISVMQKNKMAAIKSDMTSPADVGAVTPLRSNEIQTIAAMHHPDPLEIRAAGMPDGSLGAGLFNSAQQFQGYVDPSALPSGHMDNISKGDTLKVDADNYITVVPRASVIQSKDRLVPDVAIPADPSNLPNVYSNATANISQLVRPTGAQIPQSLQLLQMIKERNGGYLPPQMQAMLDNATEPTGAVPGAQPQPVPSLTQPAAQNPRFDTSPENLMRVLQTQGGALKTGAGNTNPSATAVTPSPKRTGGFRAGVGDFFYQGFEGAKASLGIPTDLQKQQTQARIGLEQATTEETRARTQAILNPPGKPNVSQPEFDKAGNIIGFRDQKGNLLGPHNPNLTQDMRDMMDAAEQRSTSPATPEGQAMAYLVKQGKTPMEAFQAIQSSKQDAKPDTGTQNKQRFQGVMGQIAGEGGNKLDPGIITDPRKMSAAITASKNISPQDKMFALSYMAANPTPASQALNVVLRGESYQTSKIYQQYDTKMKITRPVSAEEINRANIEEPGRYTSPAYDPTVVAEKAVAKDLATGKTKDQVVSFNALLGHVGDLNDGIDQLRNSKSPMINKPINWLRANAMGDPAVSNFIQRMEPVKKEYESFLLNNRALYEDDRKAAEKIINEDLSPAQMQEAMKQFAHTAGVRLGATNASYKRVKGKDIPDLLTDEADSTLRTLGVSIDGYKTPSKQPNTPPPETRVQIGAIANRPDGTRWRFKGGNSKDAANWEQLPGK